MTSVAERLQSVRVRITDACRRVGRPVESVTLIGASKRQPLERLQAAYDSGLRDFGENQVQEGIGHREGLQGQATWHLIGPLQSNKTRLAIDRFDVFHAVDRHKIARKLEGEAAARDLRLSALLEINLGREESKHGFIPDGLREAIRPLAEFEHLRIMGLMAIPPQEASSEEMRPWFRRLRELRDELFSHEEWATRAGWLSMGMSDDFEVAIEEGATHVRVGTALFGSRD